MSLTRKVAHNTLIQFTGKIIGTILALITASFMMRYLNPEGFGEYTTIIAFLGIFSIMEDLGLYLIVTREISKDNVDQEKILGNALGLKLVASIGVLALAPIAVLFFNYSPTIKWGILIGTVSFLFILLNQVIIGVFQKYLRTDKIAIGEVIGRIVWLLGVIFCVYFKLDLLWIIAFISVSNLCNFLYVYISAQRFVKIRLKFDLKVWKYLMKLALPLAFSVVLNMVYFKLDIIILSWFQPQEDVGIYGAAFKVLESLITFAAIFAGLLLPVMARYATKDRERFARIYRKGFDILSVFIVPLIVGTLFLAEPLIVLFGGEGYEKSGVVLQILIFAVGSIYFSHLFGNTVIALGHQKKIVWIYLSAAMAALVVNFTLIPLYSYYGAAVSSLICEGIVFFGTLILVYRTSKIWPHFKTFWKSLLAAGVMAIVLYFLPDWDAALTGNETLNLAIELAISITIAALVYFVIIYLLRGVDKSIIKEVLSLKKEKSNVEE